LDDINIIEKELTDTYLTNNWSCLEKRDAHQDKIWCIASSGNMLCTTSAKNFKVWDIENFS